MTTQYTDLLEKIAAAELELHPTLQDVMARVREAGLHKVAAQMYAVPEFELKVAAQRIGTQMYLNRHRQMKIASGIRALAALEAEGSLPFDGAASDARRLGAVKVANMFRLSPGGIKNLVPGAGQAAGHGAAQQAGHAMPQALGAPVAQTSQHAGLFGNVKPVANDLNLGQTISKLRNEEMSMGIRPGAPLAPKPGAVPATPAAPAVAPPAPRPAAPAPSKFQEPDAGLQQMSAAATAERQVTPGDSGLIQGLQPVPAQDHDMWRMIYEQTKEQETNAARRASMANLPMDKTVPLPRGPAQQ